MAAGTTVLEKFGEKSCQGPLKDGIGVVGVDGRLRLAASGKHCMIFSIRRDSHFLHLPHRKQTISIQRISERGLQKNPHWSPDNLSVINDYSISLPVNVSFIFCPKHHIFRLVSINILPFGLLFFTLKYLILLTLSRYASIILIRYGE